MPDLPVLALLAGGLATRLQPLTQTLPKSLIVLDGEPFLAHQLRLLVKQGVREIVICCGNFGEQIEEFAGDGSAFGCHVRYSYDGTKLLGTGGSIRHALPLLGQRFLVMYGDSYLPSGPAKIWDAFLASGQPALMSVFQNEDRWDASNVVMRDGRICRYGKRQRTQEMRYIDYGLSVLPASAFESRQDGETFDLSDIFERLVADEKLAAFEVEDRFYEIGSFNGLRETETLLQHLRLTKIPAMVGGGL
jgi:NDP-sugar pyrophosphorylase family protein